MYDFGYMQADMDEQKLSAQNVTAKASVDIECQLHRTEDELSRCREELAMVSNELAAVRKESSESASSARRISLWALGVAVASCIAAFVVPFIVIAVK